MKLGDRVKIVNLANMWDRVVYYHGWEITQKDYIESESVPIPDFDEDEEFNYGDEAIIVDSYEDFIEAFMLEVILTDKNGNDFICHSQAYSIEDLKSICDVI